MHFRALLVVGLIFLVEMRMVSTAPLEPNDEEKTKEAVKITLESTGELIPQEKMVQKIKSDLKLIRYLDKGLIKRTHTGKWKPGQIVARISSNQLREVEQSEFKPVKSIIKDSGDKILIFSVPYHPEQLARLLKLRFGFDSKPNFINTGESGKGSQILYRHDLSTYFWNSVNGKNCEEGCFTQYSVSVNVDNEGENEYSKYDLNFLNY